MKKYTIAGECSVNIKEELEAYSEFTQILLFNRNITTAKEAHIFLNPDYERDINNPFLILGMGKAVERILLAIKNKEKIVIYGDYDCDGIPGSVVLYDFFKKIGYENFENYIPHRHKEGYGLNLSAVKQFAKNKIALLITIDCGITDIEEIDLAHKLSIDVIVTDHHLPSEVLPSAYVILNSKQKEDSYPDDMLCGAGVAWKLVSALLVKMKENNLFDVKKGWEKWLLDMVGISTVADMVPLTRENRALAYFGLKVLRKSPRPGLQKLLRKAGANQIHLTEDDIGFTIAPRINAASRMDVPMVAFDLLSENDDAKAGALSNHLHKINDERKLTVARIVKEAKKILRKREPKDVIVIGNPQWRIGVLGIVASNIVDEYHCPVFVWGREGDMDIKGSCRGDGSVNLVELMRTVDDDIFVNIGGHAGAGGFSVFHDRIHLLEEKLISGYAKVKKEEVDDKITLDKKISIDDVNWNTYNEIEKLSPFGVGNPKPTFLIENIPIAGIKLFGKEKNHLELQFKNSKGNIIPAIGFFMDMDTFDTFLEVDKKINLIATIEKSMFRGRRELRLRIVDVI